MIFNMLEARLGGQENKGLGLLVKFCGSKEWQVAGTLCMLEISTSIAISYLITTESVMGCFDFKDFLFLVVFIFF